MDTEARDETSRPERRPAELQNLIDKIGKGLPPPPPELTMEQVIARQIELSPDPKGRIQALCFRCGRTPAEVHDYDDLAEELNVGVDDVVRREEGTFNFASVRFACNACYIAIGQPSSPQGWRAP